MIIDETTFPKDIDTAQMEEACRKLWDEHRVNLYDPNQPGEMFSVDTPPPYVSASHLHVGHAMSYAQAEFIVRYQRMRGRNVFYPMGFDDNGLPTERFVEKKYSINKRKTTRKEFRELCLQVTAEGIKQYEELWRALGLSVDWRLRYSTIDEHCRRTAQKSFIELFQMGRIYRSNEPVLWDTHFETALAQADLESLERKGKLHQVSFPRNGAEPLIIATTRPELIPACVALYCNPGDERYKEIIGKSATVPLSHREVPIKADADVSTEFGTGLMMVCTFGDGEDVRRWKRDGLDTRLCINPNGKMTELAGTYAGLTVDETRKKIVSDLQTAGLLGGNTAVDQVVSVSERSGVPVEFIMAPQWFIKMLDLKAEFLKRSEELRWFPDWMKTRLDQWIEGLKYDWNIARQRFYGVPFPVWFCGSCNEPVLATEASLPIDPLEDPCPASACPKCGGKEFRGDPDVMDTWMTSSLSPLINANWAGTPGRLGSMNLYPMTVRVQAFEIIRTWLFYTLAKSHFHTNSLPWNDVMISGWGLNENGRKISKRDLEQFTDATGYNRYDPYAVIKKFGADSVRFWAAGGSLGHDLRFNERDIQNGRKLVVKLWNAARFCALQFGGFDAKTDTMPFAERTPEDRWVLMELNKIIPVVTAAFDNYSYHEAREATEKFFWSVFCDDYLEMIKDRFWTQAEYPEHARISARCTMREALRLILALYAPFVPYITESIYQILFREGENTPSLHVSKWPEFDSARTGEIPEMTVVSEILTAVRGLRTTRKIAQTRRISTLTLDIGDPGSKVAETIKRMELSIKAAARSKDVIYGPATVSSGLEQVRLDIAE